jgi:hypothetical protein
VTNNTCIRCKDDMPSHRVNTLCEECFKEEYRNDYDDGDYDDNGEPCSICGGSGTVPDNGTNMGECEECNGTGVIE